MCGEKIYNLYILIGKFEKCTRKFKGNVQLCTVCFSGELSAVYYDRQYLNSSLNNVLIWYYWNNIKQNSHIVTLPHFIETHKIHK